tara:strand:- start:237 stop:620 length:384 start_codon:yes stop_codon:yes gene_type:complete
MGRHSKIDMAGLTVEALDRWHEAKGTRNAKANAVRRWLETQNVFITRQAVMNWCERRALTDDVRQALTLPPAEVVVEQVRVVAPEIQAIMDLAMSQVADGTATQGSAKTLEIALKAAIAQRVMAGNQ